MEYLGKRRGVDAGGREHGLFTADDDPIDLRRVQAEVGNHPGNLWTVVVSMRREDAARLGLESQAAWKQLVRSQLDTIADSFKIDPANLRWYGAFHNESHHPHIHIALFAKDGKQGFLSETGIERMRSAFANTIFHDENLKIYQNQTLLRDELRSYTRQRMRRLAAGISQTERNEAVEQMLRSLSVSLRRISGKKVYAYLPAPLKGLVNGIVRELAKDPRVVELYAGWLECRRELCKAYQDNPPAFLPLEEQPEFRPIKNEVIRQALLLDCSERNQHEQSQNKELESTGSQALFRNISWTGTDGREPNSGQAPERDALSATLAASRLLKDFANIIHASYVSSHEALFGTDRKLRQKIAWKKRQHGQRWER